MAWSVTLKVVECDSLTTLLPGAAIWFGTQFLGNTDGNGQFLVVDPTDTWEWVNLTVKKSGTGGQPTDPGYHPGYLDKNVVIHSNKDGTIQEVCLNDAPIPDPNGGNPWEGCFIVTATTGSAESLEVQQLRRLRDRVRAASELGGELIDRIYREYAQFSPPIAADLKEDALTRAAVLQVVVRPLFAWYTLAGKLALEPANASAASLAAQQAITACPASMAGAMLPLLDTLRAGVALPADTPAPLRTLASQLAHLPFASWAIVDPLARMWSAASDSGDLVDEVSEWLATAPLDALSPVRDPHALATELDALANFFAFRPSARRQLGVRLAAAWPDAADALAHAGLVAPASPETEA